MRVLGIDPGLGTTGYAVVDLDGDRPALVEAGTIRPPAEGLLPVRLLAVRRDLVEVIREFNPDLVGLESLYAEYKFPRSALQMAHVRGVICVTAAEQGLRVIDIAPSSVKAAVVGAGGATKEQVQATVQTLYHLEETPHPHDVADAIAVATAVAYREARRIKV